MEVKNLFDPSVKQDVVSRINKLGPQSQRQWGKMNVAQMLAHVQVPMGVALGTNTVRGSWMMRMILPFFKKSLYDAKEWKHGLPTDRTFVMLGADKNFTTEKISLLDKINNFSEEKMISEKHPVFGKLTKEQWSMATWKHIDHHLRQFGV